MKALRWVGASVLGLVGALLGLVGALLCVTLVLAPLGIPLLLLARRLFKTAGQLVVPRAVRHPVEALSDTASNTTSDMGKRARRRGKTVQKQGKAATRTAAKKTHKTKKKVAGAL